MLRLILATLLNILTVVIEIIVGILSGSLALLADALHNLQDVFALIISIIAQYLMGKSPTPRTTYGYRRAEALGAFIGSILLILSVLYVSYEAISALFESHRRVIGAPMIMAGGMAVLINGLSAYLLHGDENLNIKSAYLHLLGDTAFSVAVVIGGVVMLLTGWSYVDSILTLIFAPILIRDGLSLLLSSVNILMEFAPQGYDSLTISKIISSVRGVKEVHDIHVWALSSSEPHVSAHVVLSGNPPASEIDRILREANERLKNIGIKHITLQVEPEGYPCSTSCS